MPTKTAIATLIDAGKLPDVRDVAGRLKAFKFDVVFASQAADFIELGDLPAGFDFHYGVIQQDTTSGGTATIAIGISGTTGKYRTAAINNGTAAIIFGNYAARLTAKERLLLTVAGAALPASGNMKVIMYGTVGD
jgi:hypothetical protein